MRIVLGSFVFFFFMSCSATTDDYQSSVDAGWLAYEEAQFTDASFLFVGALAIDPSGTEAWNGLGWSRLRRDSLDGAADAFQTGSALSTPTADLYAGWGFVLNAQKNYGGSNTQTISALSADPQWQFVHEAGLTSVDLKILLAENYFALGQFSQSLTAVQSVNVDFTADVSNTDGQAELAAEIERLKLIN